MKLVTSNIPKDLLKITPIAVQFFIDHYFDPFSKERVEEIAIRFWKDLYDEAGDTIAYCDFEEDEDNPDGLPDCFNIIFNDNKYRDVRHKVYLKTLFHELCHADQYLSGRLQQKEDNNEEKKPYNLWNGKRFEDDHDYWKQPWEIEAYGTEETAYNKFVELYPELKQKRNKQRYNGRFGVAWFNEQVNKIIKSGSKR
jgi:hypothetical protein